METNPFIFPEDEEITAEVVQDFIEQHQARIPRYRRLKNMYIGDHPIKHQDKKPDYKPDNRLVVNFAKYIVDTFNGYFIGIPVKIQHDDKKINELVDDFQRMNDMDDNQAELSKMSSIYGHAFEIVYQDENAETHCTYCDPTEMFIVYDDTIQERPLFAVHYHIIDDKLIGTVYTRNEIIKFAENDEKIAFGERKPHYFGDVPVIEYIENEERQSIFENVESLINAYNKAISEKANDVDYFSDAYLKILGAELDEETLRHIRDNRIINLFGSNTELEKIIVEFMEKPSADETQENLLNRIERLIYQISMVGNINDEKFSNAPSGVALELKLQPMKNLAAMKERKFASGLNRRFKIIFHIWGIQRKVDANEWRNLNYVFTRNIPRNLMDEAEIAGKLTGITSKETQLSVLSFVDNPQLEIERIKQEENERMSSYLTNDDGDFYSDPEDDETEKVD